MITASEFKGGLTLEHEGVLYVIVEYQHVKPGKGGAFVRTKMKNLRTKKVIEKTFRVEERFQEAFIEEKKMQYMYCTADTYHFMDQETFEELILNAENISEIVNFLKENMEVSGIFYKHELIEITLPTFINLKITHTEPGIKGDTAKSSYKPATVETGAIVQVPLFVNENDTIKIDTRTGTYVERI
ncbi:MAG: elongation factor P [Candidatus Omnitrophica bacterium]|nr:elongation factor P [Candidatus Omnitrophota bacterium]